MVPRCCQTHSMRSAYHTGSRTLTRTTLAVTVLVAAGGGTGCNLLDSLGGAGHIPRIAWHVTDVASGTPASDGREVFFIARDHSVTGLDPATGKAIWRTPTGTPGPSGGFSSCQVAGDLVACGDSGIVAFRKKDGSLLWRFDVPREQPGLFPFAVAGGAIFAGSLGRGTVYAIDAATGHSLWTAPALSADPNGVNIPSVISDGEIVAAVFVRGTRPQTGGVIGLDAASGSLRWLTEFSLAAADSASGGSVSHYGIRQSLHQATTGASTRSTGLRETLNRPFPA